MEAARAVSRHYFLHLPRNLWESSSLVIPLIKASSSCLNIVPTAVAYRPLTLLSVIRGWVGVSMSVKAALLPLLNILLPLSQTT